MKYSDLADLWIVKKKYGQLKFLLNDVQQNVHEWYSELTGILIIEVLFSLIPRPKDEEENGFSI